MSEIANKIALNYANVQVNQVNGPSNVSTVHGELDFMPARGSIQSSNSPSLTVKIEADPLRISYA